MRNAPLMFAALLLLELAACSGRRGPQGPNIYSTNYRTPRDENFNGGPNALLLKYDANHDGAVTRAELTAGLKAEFDAHDTRHTGCLDVEQVGIINAARIEADRSTATPLQDWNLDGCIDLREFSTAANSLFAQLDINNDGTVSAQEFGPRRGPGQGAGLPGAAESDGQKPPEDGRGRRGEGGRGGGPGGGSGRGPGGPP